MRLGGARVGDKTLVDSFVPFVDVLASHIAEGRALAYAWARRGGCQKAAKRPHSSPPSSAVRARTRRAVSVTLTPARFLWRSVRGSSPRPWSAIRSKVDSGRVISLFVGDEKSWDLLEILKVKILITGAGGFVGYRLAQALLKKGTLADAAGKQAPICAVVLFDMASPPNVDARFKCVTGDLTDQACVAAALERRYRRRLSSGVGGQRRRREEEPISTSACASISTARAACSTPAANCPSRRASWTRPARSRCSAASCRKCSTTARPTIRRGRTARKKCCEYLVTDYSRKGYIDGRSLRLPTISVYVPASQSGRLVVRQQHHPRAFERYRLGLPGRPRRQDLAALAGQDR